MRLAFALALALAACGSARPPTPPASPPPIAGFDTCDLVTLDSKDVLTTWRFTPSGVERLGQVTVGTPAPRSDDDVPGMTRPSKAEWADRDHLFVSPDAHTVLLITAGGIERLAVPDLAKRLAKPDDGASETGFGKTYTLVDLVVRDGEAWWSKCPWSYPNDGGYCAGWISARLWPSPKTVREEVSPREVAWTDAGGPECEPTRPDDEHELYGAHWLAANRLLVLWGYHSEFDSPPPDRWELRERCDGKPIASGNDPRPVRDGLWLSREHREIVIRRGDAVIGHVPDVGPIAIRPAATSRRR